MERVNPLRTADECRIGEGRDGRNWSVANIGALTDIARLSVRGVVIKDPGEIHVPLIRVHRAIVTNLGGPRVAVG